MLEVHARRAAPTIHEDDAKKTVLAEIEASLVDLKRMSLTAVESAKGYPVWIEAYRLERLLALIEPKECLWDEVKSRMAEAVEEKLNSAPRLAAAVDATGSSVFDTQTPPALRDGGEMLLRSLLLEILEDLHWAAERKYYSRPIRETATHRIIWCGIISFALFIMPYIILHISLALGKTSLINNWSYLPLYSAVTAGLFGALFSRLLYLQSNWDALSVGGLKDARDFTSIFLRGCVGMTGAVVVFFFLQSGVVSGPLFPDFSQIGVEDTRYPNRNVPESDQGNYLHLVYPSKSLALLVVWSFLAGFSERLVPSILRDTENSFAKPAPEK
jgi:hypothetical protein